MGLSSAVFGVLLSALCCFLSALGMLLMKHSAAAEDDVPLYKRKWWALGLLSMGALPLPINMMALSLAPISLLAPFGGLTIIFSLLLARHGFLSVHETVSIAQVFAVGIVIVGMVLVSVFGPQGDATIEEGDGAVTSVMFCTSNAPFMILLAFCLVGIGATVGSWGLPKRYRLETTSTLNAAMLAFTAAACGALANLCVKILGVALRSLTKSDGVGRLPPQTTAVCVALIIALASLELYVLNSVLANSPVALAVPLFQALLITLQVATGGTFYREFDSLGGARLAGFVFGALVVVVGVTMLSYEKTQTDRKHSIELTESNAMGDPMATING